MDAQLSILRERQESMELKINELRDMNRKRDDEVKQIKDTISECRNKVIGMRGIVPSADLYPLSSSDTELMKVQDGIWKLTDPRNFKMLGGLMLLHYSLSHSSCVMPYVGGLFSYLFAFVTFYHFVIVTGLPLARKYIFKENLDDSTFQKVDTLFMPWNHLIGAGLSFAAIQILAITKCKGWCITSSVQMITRIGCFCVEYATYCYPELEKLDPNNNSSMNKITAILLGANVVTFIAPI